MDWVCEWAVTLSTTIMKYYHVGGEKKTITSHSLTPYSGCCLKLLPFNIIWVNIEENRGHVWWSGASADEHGHTKRQKKIWESLMCCSLLGPATTMLILSGLKRGIWCWQARSHPQTETHTVVFSLLLPSWEKSSELFSWARAFVLTLRRESGRLEVILEDKWLFIVWQEIIGPVLAAVGAGLSRLCSKWIWKECYE